MYRVLACIGVRARRRRVSSPSTKTPYKTPLLPMIQRVHPISRLAMRPATTPLRLFLLLNRTTPTSGAHPFFCHPKHTNTTPLYKSLYSKVSLQRRPHISRRQRHKQRTLPPYPQPLASRRRASLAQQKSHPITKTKVRGLPVPPLSMDNFPTISPECATPAPSIAQRESYYPSMEAWIDWKTLMEEILDGTMPPPWNS